MQPTTKKADVAEYPKVLDHVGLLFNEPPSTAGLFSIESSDNFVGESRSNAPRHSQHGLLYTGKRQMQ
jgi:hypothetical protein